MTDDPNETALTRIERAIGSTRIPVSLSELQRLLSPPVPRRTLQLQLSRLVEAGRLQRLGRARATRYVAVEDGGRRHEIGEPPALPLSSAAAALVRRVRRPLAQRTPVGYDPDLLFAYVPNETRWLTDADRARLRAIEPPEPPDQPAATHARDASSTAC